MAATTGAARGRAGVVREGADRERGGLTAARQMTAGGHFRSRISGFRQRRRRGTAYRLNKRPGWGEPCRS